MGNSKLEVDIVMKNGAEKVWKITKDFSKTFPKALPNTFESIEIVQGDGKSVGSVLKATFKPPELEGGVSSKALERIDLIDEEKKTISYTYLEADALKYYKNFKGTICVTTQDDGCVVKFSAEFDKENQQIPDPIFYKDFVVKLFQDLDAYINA